MLVEWIFIWVLTLWPCNLIPLHSALSLHTLKIQWFFNTSAMHSLTFISLQMLLFLPETLTFPQPLSTVTFSKKLFPTTPVLVRYPSSVFPLPEHLLPIVPQLPVYLPVFLIMLHMSWGQWLCPSHSHCLLSNSTVPGTNRHSFDECMNEQGNRNCGNTWECWQII